LGEKGGEAAAPFALLLFGLLFNGMLLESGQHALALLVAGGLHDP
jgi:hypothetical protein